jgi:hypothetical protein
MLHVYPYKHKYINKYFYIIRLPIVRTANGSCESKRSAHLNTSVGYRNKTKLMLLEPRPGIELFNPTRTGIFLVRYRTEMMDVGMPMPELESSMPMPSWACYPKLRW